MNVRNAPLTCTACDAGRGCGAALLAGRPATSSLLWEQAEACPEPGDSLVPARTHGVLHASALGYGLPLLGVVIGTSVGATFGGDAAAMLGAFVGVVASLVTVKLRVAARNLRWRVIPAANL